MALITYDPDIPVEYVPAYAGNRDSDNPCVVKLKFVPYIKVQHYSKLIAARTKGMSDILKTTEASHDIQKKQFMESVESISGYSKCDREIKTPGEFYEAADTDLIIEIIRAMESAQKLTEGQKKIS